ncbi:hypothetical protein ACP4OV_005011 [Aristida adscensionis]
MATTQFAMVEELASLIRDNLHSKHLVLATEEALIALLQQEHRDGDDDDAGIIELEPAGAYHRLLLHRLADIYGFAHESVGEGEDRHLVLQRCPETAIPPVLVSDMLWKYDNCDDNCDDSASVVLTRNDTDCREPWRAEFLQEDISVESLHLNADPDLKPRKQSVVLPVASLKEREAAYRAARKRIFSTDDAKEKDAPSTKCRQVPVVAQRMIAHALGKKVQNPTETVVLAEGKGKQLINGLNFPISSRNSLYPVTPDNKEVSHTRNSNSSAAGKNSFQNPCGQRSRSSGSRIVSAETLKNEQTGAAKRMFAHALGLSTVQGSNGALPKAK